MQKISILPANSTLSDSIRPHHLSILSYNILIPNHPQSWWVCKYYHPHIPMSQRQWPTRQALLLQQLIHANSDLICLQEVNHQHFESDFEALHQQAYTDSALIVQSTISHTSNLLHKLSKFISSFTVYVTLPAQRHSRLLSLLAYFCMISW